MVWPSHSRSALRGISPEAGVLRDFCPTETSTASWLPQTSFWMAELLLSLSQEGSYKTFLSMAFPPLQPWQGPVWPAGLSSGAPSPGSQTDDCNASTYAS